MARLNKSARVAIDTLRRTRERIAKRSAWTQGVYARTKYGKACISNDPRAVRWCLIGALSCEAVVGTDEWRTAINALTNVTGSASLAYWNDNRKKHAEVPAAIDRAIQLIEKGKVIDAA